MREDRARIGQQPAPVARVMTAVAQVAVEDEVEGAARTEDGKISVVPMLAGSPTHDRRNGARLDQGPDQPARPGARLFARRGRRLRRHRRRSAEAATDLARQPGRRGHQRHRGAGLGNIGPLAAKPVMEGKGGACSRSSPASTCSTSRSTSRPRQAGRHHRRARADLRRHQPRGHQGAGVLLHRAQAARAHEDPGVPRRPARHRDHRRRGGAQRPARSSARRSRRSSWSLRRRRRGARLPRPAGEPRREGGEHLVTDIKGVVYRAAPRTWTEQGALRAARPTRARWPR
jgi:hypothetical protein